MKNASKTSLILALTFGVLIIGSALPQISFAGNKDPKLTAQQQQAKKQKKEANKAIRAEMKAYKKTLSSSMTPEARKKAIRFKKGELLKIHSSTKK